MRTSSPSRCTCTRAPSSFHSTDAGPVCPSASVTSAALAASIGWIGCSTASRTASSASCPSVERERGGAAQVAREHRGAPDDARSGCPAAVATASVITPASAPWRSSPVSSRRTKSTSGSVAREKRSVSSAWRAACEPAPDVPASSVRIRSTSRISTDGSAAGSTSWR